VLGFPTGFSNICERFKKMENKIKTVIYARVSKSDESQNPDNQLVPLRQWASSLGYEVVKEYVEYISGGDSNRPQFQEMMKDSRKHQFSSILVWSLDRFSREGISNTLHYLEKLEKNGVALKSHQESWVDTADEGIGKVLIAIMSWVAKQERLRISERTKAGLVVAKRNGKKLGRPFGSKDKGYRKKSSYWMRWANKKKELVNV